MEFAGKGQPLTRSGLSAALDRMGFAPGDAAFIWAVVEVETSERTQGFGFRMDRRPQILFERHKFRKFTSSRFDAEAPDVSGPPGGYGTAAGQYARLEKALDLSDKAGLGVEPALQATSWGMGQVLGENHDSAGFGSAEAMVQAMVRGEDEQLAGMASFIQSNNLATRLASKDWAGFARGYNGKNYWEHQYDVRLDQQYQRFASGSLPSLEVRAAQAGLLYLGFSPGKIDGVLGPRTRGALRNFRLSAGLPAGGELDGPTYIELSKRAGIDA
jgi:hypothetical protein